MADCVDCGKPDASGWWDAASAWPMPCCDRCLRLRMQAEHVAELRALVVSQGEALTTAEHLVLSQRARVRELEAGLRETSRLLLNVGLREYHEAANRYFALLAAQPDAEVQ